MKFAPPPCYCQPVKICFIRARVEVEMIHAIERFIYSVGRSPVVPAVFSCLYVFHFPSCFLRSLYSRCVCLHFSGCALQYSRRLFAISFLSFRQWPYTPICPYFSSASSCAFFNFARSRFKRVSSGAPGTPAAAIKQAH